MFVGPVKSHRVVDRILVGVEDYLWRPFPFLSYKQLQLLQFVEKPCCHGFLIIR